MSWSSWSTTDIHRYQHGTQVNQNRQLYAEEVKGLQRPLFVPPPGGKTEQVYYDEPLHTPVYVEVRDYSVIWLICQLYRMTHLVRENFF